MLRKTMRTRSIFTENNGIVCALFISLNIYVWCNGKRKLYGQTILSRTEQTHLNFLTE